MSTDVIDYEWPEGVPENYDELFRDYGDFVAKRVERYNKVDRNFEDLLQDIWARLIASQVLEKYVERASQTLPPTLMAREACAYLGLTFEAFVKIQQHKRVPSWLPTPTPINGVDPSSDQAVYRQSEILDLDEHLDDLKFAKRTEERTMVFVGAQGFRAYLTQAIHNHFANWCRTRSRKYKDVLLAQNAVVVPTGIEGTFAHVGHNEEGAAWEQALVSASLDAEELSQCHEFIGGQLAASKVDPKPGAKPIETLKSLAARANIDMTKVDDWEEYVDDEGKRRMRPTEEARQALEVLDYISQGYTIREAVKTQQRAETRRMKLQAKMA